MALLANKLYIQKGSTTQSANIYSTTAEAGSNYLSAKIGSTTGYIPLVATTDTRATNGRVTKSGTDYAIGSTAVPAYTKWGKASGSGNFTVPANVTKLRVTCVGGGSGGLITEATEDDSKVTNIASSAGGATTFGSVVANGGTAPSASHQGYSVSYDEYSNLPSGGGYSASVTAGKGFYNSTIVSGNTNTVTPTAVPITDYKGNVLYQQHGTGGSVNACGTTASAVGTGNKQYTATTGASGYRTIQTISVTPGQVIAWSVGAGGQGRYRRVCVTNAQNTAVSAWTTFNNGGVGPGTAGAIVVEYGIGIE